jgi:23S rRNA pseudouridine1911/1915/1917 synthase
LPKPSNITLGDDTVIPILHEDRSVIAIDKPASWMLVPHTWQKTDRNLQAAIVSSIGAGDFWARSRNLKFLRYIHRLDGETSGVLLFGRSQGAVETYGRLFESRQMDKSYLVVVHGKPRTQEWTSREAIGPDPREIGRMMVDERGGKHAETHFTVLHTAGNYSLLEARPVTGRTHQIRIHLLAARHPVVGDELYAPDARGPARKNKQLGLRAVFLGYQDPFTRRPIRIEAPTETFLRDFGFPPLSPPAVPLSAPETKSPGAKPKPA